MKDEIQERYVFWRFAIQDFFECADTIDLMAETENDGIKIALFKYAVICYCRPFTANEAKFKKQKWKIDDSLVSDKALHNKIMDLRSKLFAHSDVPFREPVLGKMGDMYPISMKSFSLYTALDLASPLSVMAKELFSVLIKMAKEYERENF
jgi:hypothetical protein